MAGYKPLKVTGNSTGLVLSRENFLLPDDAYPQLENAYVWRERIMRKQGFELLGRLRRVLTAQALGNASGAGTFTGNIKSIFSLEANAQIEVGSIVITDGIHTFTDNSSGALVGIPSGSGTINYVTGAVTITGATALAALVLAYNYFPNLPVMGLRTKEINSTNNEDMIAFDQKYAYKHFSTGFEEYIPGTTWSGSNSDFFWSTNYWVSAANDKLFWVTNFSGISGDPIRYTDGTTWFDFGAGSSPLVGVINAAGDYLNQCLCLLPFRGRLVAFNTLEGQTLGTSVGYTNRIRWAAIGNPLIVQNLVPTPPVIGPWRDDVRGKGGFLDIPTSEDIITVGFVRDNLVIYCERSTWQLRYTGRSIAPFQIEKVNSELGAESTFSAVQFDTSLVGVGDKGIVECDSFKSERIDIKIPDLVQNDFNNNNNGTKRVHGIRNFETRLAFWLYPSSVTKATFPDRRLVYNYENDSWAIFTDSLTALGNFQTTQQRTWADSHLTWSSADFTWNDRPSLFSSVMGGNQQGYVLYLDEQTNNEESLYISDITGNAATSETTVITSPNHNMQTGAVIKIIGLVASDPYVGLNDQIFGIDRVDANSFKIYKYDSDNGQFDLNQEDAAATYLGGGQIEVRDNFKIVSKRFNYMELGQQYQLGYIDLLMDSTESGAMTLNVYNDYQDYTPTNASNKAPLNQNSDTFFNSTIETSSDSGVIGGQKNWKRVFCPTCSNFITIEYTLSNEQMQNICQESNVQIDAQVIWSRPGGRLGITN